MSGLTYTSRHLESVPDARGITCPQLGSLQLEAGSAGEGAPFLEWVPGFGAARVGVNASVRGNPQARTLDSWKASYVIE